MNLGWSQEIFRLLHSEGVREIVFCPGARNSPLVVALASSRGFQLHSFFEERSAAFFALGIARRTGLPVAVVTTSGTAVCELLPAAAEAFYSGVPVIFLTADRPRRLRGTGAPQAIDQVGLFAKFAGKEFDLESGELFSLEAWNRRSPVHLNICFDEPLVDETKAPLELSPGIAPPSFAGRAGFSISSGHEWAELKLTKFLRHDSGALLVIVGTLETEIERLAVARFLSRLGAPVYLEATSGLRERLELSGLALRAGDRVLDWALKRKMFQRVLRIGGIPTARIWRDLDDANSTSEVLSLSPLPFSGLSRGELICSEIAPVVSGVEVQLRKGEFTDALYMKDRANSESLEAIFRGDPFSEPAMFRSLSRLIPKDALVYVGNSLPIREWDLGASFSRPFIVEANRGVNGIDGQVATFLGLARPGVENWAILGDLTALYDFAGLWALNLRPELRIRIVIVNNYGGKIFSRIFNTDIFENRHALRFEHWARMWDANYQSWTSVPEAFQGSNRDVIELQPDEHSSRRFWEKYAELW